MLGGTRLPVRRSGIGARRGLVPLVLLVALLISACAAQESEHVARLEAQRQEALGATALFGAFTYGGVWSGMEPVYELEAHIGRRLDIVHWFSSWDAPYYPELVRRASEGGRLPMISWQPDNQSMSDIARGRHDAYIRSWARGAATTEGPVYVRPFAEMNGDWVPWYGDNATFRRAWRRVVDIFDEEGADNVRWVFSPNVTDWPVTPENSMEAYYPGHEYVDVLALDGYNWGDTKPNLGWQSFATVFREGYERIAFFEIYAQTVGGELGVRGAYAAVHELVREFGIDDGRFYDELSESLYGQGLSTAGLPRSR